MKDFPFISGKKAVSIIAHPDDETIWMGGTILNHPELDWTIYSLCRQSDTDREPKFRKVCQHYGATPLISDLDDSDELSLALATREAESLIEENIGVRGLDYLFTHGYNGEYGHERHLAVHRAVQNLIDNKKLKPEAVFYFNYKNNKEGKDPLVVAGPKSDLVCPLLPEIFLEKKRIVSEMYGYPYEGIDVSYATNPEVFKIKIFR